MYKHEYSNNMHKEYVRFKVFELAMKLNSTNTILTLAHNNYELETQLLDAGKTVVIVERDKETYDRQLYDLQTRVLTQELHLVHANLSTYLANTSIKLDVAYLDFCGPFCKEVHKSLIDINANYVVITLLKAREVYQTHMYKDSTREDAHTLFFKSCGYSVSEINKYSNTSPMIVYVLKRITPLSTALFVPKRIQIKDRLDTMPDIFMIEDVRRKYPKQHPNWAYTFVYNCQKKGLIKNVGRGRYQKY